MYIFDDNTLSISPLSADCMMMSIRGRRIRGHCIRNEIGLSEREWRNLLTHGVGGGWDGLEGTQVVFEGFLTIIIVRFELF